MNIQTSLGVFRRYLMWLRYDGSRFSEMATGPNGFGIVDTFHRCLERCLPEASTSDIKIAPSSRTDSGVHAFRCPILTHIPVGKDGGLDDTPERKAEWMSRMNVLMNCVEPGGIELVDFHSVHPGFSPRRHVAYRRYVYRIVTPKSEEVYLRKPSAEIISDRRYVWILPQHFDPEKAANACRMFIGVHNMASFFKYRPRDFQSDPYPKTERFIHHVSLTPGEGYMLTSPDHNYYNITVISRSFIREQIRRMISVIAAHACGRLTERDIRWLLDHPNPNNFFAFRGLKAAPPNGLFLTDVVYDPKSFTDPRHKYCHAWDSQGLEEEGDEGNR
ncbi:hypothetical protein FO519_001106 [Halicephalobus sp. NKZ332]|nr:hypothetical protein FO519_001106 [Halicephalobus sp. NKZ332]